MAIERIFLGWDGPCLPRASRWLGERYVKGDRWEMDRVLVVTPTGRAGRRLMELLAEMARGKVFFPPEVVTVGDLPGYLYEPGRPAADGVRALLARVHSLRESDGELLKMVVREAPGRDDWAGWLRLAEDLAGLHEELAGGGVAVGEVASRCEAAAPATDFVERPRWEAMAKLQRAYEEVLAKIGLEDRFSQRLAAARGGRCGADRPIVLVSMIDMNRATRQMLEQLNCQVTALVHAPRSEAENFDAIGCVAVDRWVDRELDLGVERVRVVGRQRDVAAAGLRCVERVSKAGLSGKKLRADQVTVGLGDKALAWSVERVFELADVPVRPAVGREVVRTRPGLLLAAMAGYLEEKRFDAFAALVRHPDVEEYLKRRGGMMGEGIEHWVTLLDRYWTEHLQGKLTGRWLGDEKVARQLKSVFGAVEALIPADYGRTKSLGEWSGPIAEILKAAYEGVPLDAVREEDYRLMRSLELLGGALREQAGLGSGCVFSPRVTMAEAIGLTLGGLRGQAAPEPGGPAAVELLGWLELQLDDAPVLVVTGFNEGFIPQSVNADSFLPDSVRRVLGLLDNRARLARDKAMLTAILASRPEVALIASRRGWDDEPLVPSRLMMSCGVDRLVESVRKFYGGGEQEEGAAAVLMGSGEQSRFVVPVPGPVEPAIKKLRVTAFKDYLACPYRFYLKHVLKLEAVGDGDVEMDAPAFGSVAHEVLRRWGNSEWVSSDDASAIRRFLVRQVDEVIGERFGGQPVAAVMVQREQLRERLGAFAAWQAGQAREGWRVAAGNVEIDLEAQLDVDGEPFTITGRVDRIDVHSELGYRVLDYKTGDEAKAPERQHRKGPKGGNKEWIDLQLPLYRLLVAGMAGSLPVTLGYVVLPKEAESVGLSPADWTEAELGGAEEEAREVVRKIREGVFWPPVYPVKWWREFGGICMDEVLDRERALKGVHEATPRLRERGGGR